jgi:ABC-type amino acid transport system permease subunit
VLVVDGLVALSFGSFGFDVVQRMLAVVAGAAVGLALALAAVAVAAAVGKMHSILRTMQRLGYQVVVTELAVAVFGAVVTGMPDLCSLVWGIAQILAVAAAAVVVVVLLEVWQ